jgi:hypothetical protein
MNTLWSFSRVLNQPVVPTCRSVVQRARLLHRKTGASAPRVTELLDRTGFAGHGCRACYRSRAVRVRGRRSRCVWILLVIACAAPLGGCTYSGGELLYALGFGRGQKVTAKFRLTDGPLMILIDDTGQRVDWPMATRYLLDDLAQELLRNKAAERIIPPQTVDHLRQSVPDFDKRGCRELGELGGAEQVLWIRVQDFLAEDQIQDATMAAYFSVNVKVINVLEKESRSRVRLWPAIPQGHPIIVTMTGSEVGMAKTKDAISKELAKRLSERVAKLFYDHRLGDFEREE